METPIDSPAGPIIKSDRTGRTRYSAEYKREVLDAFESSSLSAPVFAQQCDIKYPTFAAWLAKRKLGNRLHVSPACFTVEIIKRLTQVRKNAPDAVPVTPALEPCLLPGSVLTPSLGAYLLTQRFCYHSTFYREQWKLKAAHGIELTRNLMCSWHDHLADRLFPLYDLIAASFRSATCVRIDETPVRCLQPGLGKTALGQFWAYHHVEHGPLFDWHKIGVVASRPSPGSSSREKRFTPTIPHQHRSQRCQTSRKNTRGALLTA